MLACLHLPRAKDAGDLVALAQDFSPRYEVVAPDVVVVDVDGLDRLVGDANAVSAALVRLARERGLRVIVTLAPTRTAAMLLALSAAALRSTTRRAPDTSESPCRVVAPGESARALAPLPLTLLAELLRVETASSDIPSASTASASTRRPGPGPTRRTRGSGRNYRLAPSPGASPLVDRHAPLADLLLTLRRWGLRTLGELVALPSADLFERLGATGVAWQAVARGEDARPLVRTAHEEPFEATASLEWPIDTLEPLSFVLSGLLEPLCLRLERAERGVAVLQTTLQLVDKRAHVRRLELPAPMRDIKVLRTLILLDLESHPPDAGIDRVTVTIEPTPGRIVQHSLLARARPSPEQVATLTARLTAVLGESRVGAPALVDSYEPGAFVMEPFDGDATVPASPQMAIGTASPATVACREPEHQAGFVLRRFRHSLPVHVERVGGRPVRVTIRGVGPRSGRIVQAAGPWRTSGSWWKGQGTRDKEQGTRRKTKDERRPQKEQVHADDGLAGNSRRLQETGSRLAGAGSPEPGAGLPWDRDEWDVIVTDGTALRLSRDRKTGDWLVEGVLD